jgi:hypothetical protein
MRCCDVIRELVLPSDECDLAALAEHLAHCRTCSAAAKQSSQFNRLWELTRPDEVLHDTWDIVWARITASLASSKRTTLTTVGSPVASPSGSGGAVAMPLVGERSTFRSRRWMAAAIGLIGLGQAAAILLAVLLTGHPSGNSPSIPGAGNRDLSLGSRSPTGSQSDVAARIEIDEGQRVVIRVEGPSAKVVELTPDGASWSVDGWYEMFNYVEGMPNSVVAMQD